MLHGESNFRTIYWWHFPRHADLDVRQTCPVANVVTKLLLPLVPIRHDETLRKFTHCHERPPVAARLEKMRIPKILPSVMALILVSTNAA
jgi:hypothetical protein